MTDEFDNAEFAERHYAQTSRELGLSAPELGELVHDVARDIGAAVSDAVTAPRNLDATMAKLRGQRHMIPRAGYELERQKAIDNATALSAQADRQLAAAIEVGREALIARAQPRLAQNREALARQELTLSLGEATGDGAASRAILLAQSGSRECVAALNSPFGETLLQARGVTGQTFTETRSAVRKLAARAALEKGEDPGEIMAARALERLDALGACRGAAGMALHRSIEKAQQ